MIQEEVVVTAQRREQDIRDVPISVSTLSGDDLSNILAAGEDIGALAVRIPSFYSESSNGRVGPRFYIRGLGNTDFDLAASQPVLVVVDEVVQENVILKSFPLFDLQRVEVLKGPQGSLFGRNTPAGIVKFDTVKPTFENDGYVSASYGELDTKILEGAFGGALVDDVLAGRFSLLYQDREDWIDNGFTGQSDALGGFEELAWRGQLLWTPADSLSVLTNLHGRNLDGTAQPFRANAVGPGGDFLNGNFDRDTVFFDEGANNPQKYRSLGGSVRVDWEQESGITLTSITAYETTDGTSFGDVDGGSGAGPGAFPPPIPFPSATQDSIDELDQLTQEFRWSGEGDAMSWQAGVFLFDSTLTITTDPFFVDPSTVTHRNQSWAVFGQVSYDLSDRLNLTAGARFTEDEKVLTADRSNFPVADVRVDDSDISWDLAALYRVSDELNLFARIARGFRAPTIQARDVAFFGAPTTAGSEIITSYEAGAKATVFDNRLRFNWTAFYYEIEDQQLSAIGGAGNLIQLVNARKGIGSGFELDAEWYLNENYFFTLGYSLNDTEIDDPNLRVAPCGSGICTVQDVVDASGNALVNGNAFPHAPDTIVYATANYNRVLGDGGEIFATADYARQGETQFFLYESAEFRSDGNFELGLRLGYRRTDGSWQASLFGRNITDEENMKGGIDFNNNTVYVNEPRVWGLNVRVGL
jgi:outer membrane receptor protein involved in Fe transport